MHGTLEPIDPDEVPDYSPTPPVGWIVVLLAIIYLLLIVSPFVVVISVFWLFMQAE